MIATLLTLALADGSVCPAYGVAPNVIQTTAECATRLYQRPVQINGKPCKTQGAIWRAQQGGIVEVTGCEFPWAPVDWRNEFSQGEVDAISQ